MVRIFDSINELTGTAAGAPLHTRDEPRPAGEQNSVNHGIFIALILRPLQQPARPSTHVMSRVLRNNKSTRQARTCLHDESYNQRRVFDTCAVPGWRPVCSAC